MYSYDHTSPPMVDPGRSSDILSTLYTFTLLTFGACVRGLQYVCVCVLATTFMYMACYLLGLK